MKLDENDTRRAAPGDRFAAAGQDPASIRWRPFCYRCWRARILCLCSRVRVVDNPVEILYLQHPNERTAPFNTARLAHLSLSRSRLEHGLRFDGTRTVQDLLLRKDRVGILFPSAAAVELAQAPSGLETLVIIDGTWREARKILHLSPALLELPHYSFVPEKPSNYRIRKEPKAEFVSTIEATVAALRILDRDTAKYGELLELFDRMVDRQIDFQRMNNRPGRRRADRSDAFNIAFLEDLAFRKTPEEREAAMSSFTDEQRSGIFNISRELFGAVAS
ncbi:MAG TPA: tRNA-uridine aminocarboxypropyltransferase [Fibrobacteria bacterium]|nr:tRNA-uridine aminocarboxypropyltransferase [Fibrobacteria bacterium]